MFVGQAEQKQKNQVKAIEDFRKNHVNVLISTSIGIYYNTINLYVFQ